jgi:acetyl-CoA acetyltransferase
VAEVWIVDGVRTPVGRHGGALARVRPDDLAAVAVKALVDRRADLDPARVDDVLLGDANGAGEDNRNVARMAALLAGLPTSVPGATVNRLCGSGMEAVVEASRAVAVGDASVVIAGGVESMSRAPWVLTKPWTVALGEGAEILADEFGIDREAQDRFAAASHAKAAAAWGAGEFGDEVVPVPGAELARDESIRDDTSLEKLARLRPAFRPDGTVTAGNSSPLTDGASALLLADDAGLAAAGGRPLARVVARAVSGVEPPRYGIGPVPAAAKALERAGLGWGDLASVELNEAFAAQSLACLASWPDLDPERVNPAGGAIALGHPLGCSGARLLTTLAWRLHRAGGGYGLAAMCIGVGQGIAVVLEGV